VGHKDAFGGTNDNVLRQASVRYWTSRRSREDAMCELLRHRLNTKEECVTATR
jgi:hypothetical protein